MKTTLFLDESVDHLTAVFAKVGEDERDVYPVGARLWVVFPDELVEWQMVFDILEPLAALLNVTINTEVSGLSFQMLTIIYTTNGLVECLRAETATNLDRLIHGNA